MILINVFKIVAGGTEVINIVVECINFLLLATFPPDPWKRLIELCMPVEPSPTKWSFWTLTWSALISWITNDMVTKANHECKKVCFTFLKRYVLPS